MLPVGPSVVRTEQTGAHLRLGFLFFFFLRRMLLPTKSRQRPWRSEPGLSGLLEARVDNPPAVLEPPIEILLRPDWKPQRVAHREGRGQCGTGSGCPPKGQLLFGSSAHCHWRKGDPVGPKVAHFISPPRNLLMVEIWQ